MDVQRRQIINVVLVYATLTSSLALIFAVYATSMWKWNFDDPNSLLAQRDIRVEGNLDLMGELRLQGLDTIRCEESQHSGDSMALGSEQYASLTSTSAVAHLWKSSVKRGTLSKLADGLLLYASPTCSVVEPDALYLGQLLVEVSESGTPLSEMFLERVRQVRFLAHTVPAKHGLVQFDYSSLLDAFPECTKVIELPREVYPAHPAVRSVDVEQMLIRALIAIQELAQEIDLLKTN